MSYHDNKGCVDVKIYGSVDEIDWIKSALVNNCEDCPYIDECNESAKAESQRDGKVEFSCGEFLERKIEFSVWK